MYLTLPSTLENIGLLWWPIEANLKILGNTSERKLVLDFTYHVGFFFNQFAAVS
jgi:hypothetical protein